MTQQTITTRQAKAVWRGKVEDGQGTIQFGESAFERPYTWASRFEGGEGTSPEELLAGAYASCFAQVLAQTLARDGHRVERIDTTARVALNRQGEECHIESIELVAEARVHDLEQSAFETLTREAAAQCPISRILAGAEVRVEASLVD